MNHDHLMPAVAQVTQRRQRQLAIEQEVGDEDDQTRGARAAT